jgi:hypothetical protein
MDQNKRIIYKNEDGGVSIVVPAPGASLDDVVKAVPHGVQWQLVDVSEIPTDRTFRNAWTLE